MFPYRSVIVHSGVLLVFTLSQASEGEDVRVQPVSGFRPYTFHYSPGTAYSAGVLAEADFLRAAGEYWLYGANTNRINVEAYSRALDNWKKELETKIEREKIGLKRRHELNPSLLERQKTINENLWNRFKNYPELSFISIENGTALNFLLDRLSGSVLAYQLSAGADDLRFSAEQLAQELQLDAESMSKIRVRQRSGRESFSLTEGQTLDVNYWPPTLRGNSLRNQRTRFEDARDQMMASDNEDRLMRNLQAVERAWDALNTAFAEQNYYAKRTASVEINQEYQAGLKHLKKLYLEIFRIRHTGLNGIKDDSLKFNGTSVIAMLTHLSRNGLEFDKPRPGDEHVYHKTFQMMRDLYLIVAPVDDQVARQ